MYLDALALKDPHSAFEYSDDLVDLYAEYDYARLLDCLRASTYNLERAYEICRKRDYVPEMVFLLGRMGNNKQALTLIIERLGDVQRVRRLLLLDCRKITDIAIISGYRFREGAE